MMENGYSKLYPTLQSDPYSTSSAQQRRSVQFAATKPENQEDPRRFMPNGNVFTRETATDLYGTPLDLRFAKVFQMLHRSDVRDVQEIFQPAIEAVFGFRGAASKTTYPPNSNSNGVNQPLIPDSFCDITTDYRLVYEAGYDLLCTTGPVMRFLQTVSGVQGAQGVQGVQGGGRGGGVSVSQRFPFPVFCLPFFVQQSIENGAVPPWYRDKVQSVLDDAEPQDYVLLTAFDFYFLHFAYHLVNPDIRTNNPAHPHCLYMALLDNYSDVFFNADTIMENQRLSSTQSSSSFPRRSHHSLFFATRDAPEERQTVGGDQPPPHPLATAESLESLIHIFVEFWLNLSGFSSQRYGRKYYNTSSLSSQDRNGNTPSYSPSGTPGTPGTLGTFGTLGTSGTLGTFGNSGNRGRRQGSTQNVPTVFPPVCALQASRQIVKALHQFVYAPAVNPRNQKNLETSLLDMKRHIVPQLIQRPLYELFKTTMKKYPMDASFRFVYELWLTYIQPWRYENFSGEISGEEFIIQKEQKWTNFITENLLFYGVILQAFVDRMLRVDFGVPFNTLAVFRVAKVFSESEMFRMIKNVEDVFFAVKKQTSSLIGFSPSKSATVKNHFVDLEDAIFKYGTLGSPEFVTKVTMLLRTLLKEERRCQRKLEEQLRQPVPEKSGPAHWKRVCVEGLKSLFGLLNGQIEGMQLRPDELEKMLKQISSTMDYLRRVFDIDEFEISESETASHATEFLLDEEPSLRSLDVSSRVGGVSRPLRSQRRHTIPNWQDEVKVPYLTEPEKRSPKSWEFHFLIPLLNALSQRINVEYGRQIVEFYEGRDFVSRFVRPLIEPPHCPAGHSGRPTLPPRINLRPLASKYLLGSLLFFWVFVSVFDFGLMRGVFWMAALPAFFLLANALLEPFREAENEQQRRI